MSEFTIFPAIDLRHGQVVRLQRGDPARQTVYDSDPAQTALRWLVAGARWLHVVNLDASFGEPDPENQSTISAILSTATQHIPKGQIQLGGGLRSPTAVERAFSAGVSRTVLGTWAILQSQVTASLIARWGAARIAISLDAEDGKVKVQGWTKQTGLDVLDLALQLKDMGLKWLIFTDIARDGLGAGLNLAKTIAIAERTALCVIASGGVHSLEDVNAVRTAGLAGVIVGRALYDGSIDAGHLLGS